MVTYFLITVKDMKTNLLCFQKINDFKFTKQKILLQKSKKRTIYSTFDKFSKREPRARDAYRNHFLPNSISCQTRLLIVKASVILVVRSSTDFRRGGKTPSLLYSPMALGLEI